MLIKTCPKCGSSFTTRVRNQVCCSRQCAHSEAKVTKSCPTCGTLFELPASVAARRLHCSKACQKRRTNYKCEMCGKRREVRPSETAKRFCGDACRLKWFSQHFRGTRSPHWKGGDLPYYGPNWRQQRNKACHRDGHTCQHCGKHRDQLPEELSIAHIIPFRKFGLRNYRKANALANLLTLCRSCHARFDWAIGVRS